MSDWSSDVCSADLVGVRAHGIVGAGFLFGDIHNVPAIRAPCIILFSAKRLLRAIKRLALHDVFGISLSLGTFNKQMTISRFEARWLGNECVSTCRYRCAPYH